MKISDERRRHKSIRNAIEVACNYLPEAYSISVSFYNSGVVVTLYDPNDDEVDYESERETITQQINDALERALCFGDQEK